MMTPDSKSVRHWYIQKPISHNVPLRENGAVFQQFAPTVVQSNCEWVKVWSSEDLSKYFGMGVTRWVDVMDELSRLRASESKLVEALKFYAEFANWNLFHQQGGDMGQRAREAIAEWEEGRG